MTHLPNSLTPDCEKCFGLCCVALPFAKSTDFAFNKDGGTPCKNLQSDFRCGIHTQLRGQGFKGCTVFECFGAGQQISQVTYKGLDWRNNPESAQEMFDVFPIMQQLHEMLLYLHEAISMEETRPIHLDLKRLMEKTEHLTNQDPSFLLEFDVSEHRALVNPLLLKTSELIRGKIKPSRKISRGNLIGAKLRGADLKGSNFRGALLLAADLREADLRKSDFIGADLRDADVSSANLLGSFFLTQAQVNSAKGNSKTKLPASLKTPLHWLP